MKRTGPLPRNTPLKARKRMKPQSDKRKRYRASKEGREALEWMRAVKGLPCVICHAPPPSEAHHCRSGGMARNDYHTIALCYECHRGPNGYHMAKRQWEAANGPDYGFIPLVRAVLDQDDTIDF